MAIQIPHAPQLTNDATLIVFVHYSAPAAQQHPVLGDCHRLALLGRTMLGAAYQNAMCMVFPNLQGNVFLVSDFFTVLSQEQQTLTGPLSEQQHVNTTFPAFVNRWVTTYGWRRNMRGMPPNVNLNDQHVRWNLSHGCCEIADYGLWLRQETLRIFETYAGAVVAQQPNGQTVLFEWIHTLVNTP